MKVFISLADAATQDRKGTVSCMGLGITRLHAEKVPASFRAAAVVSVFSEPGDAAGESRKVELMVAQPDQAAKAFAELDFEVPVHRDQAVAALPFNMTFPVVGSYVFTARIDNEASCETQILVQLRETITPDAEAPQK